MFMNFMKLLLQETCKINNVMKNIVKNSAPLAERMRPTSLADYVGQSHVLGEQSLLLQLLNKGEIPNIILWGPPGCGKVHHLLYTYIQIKSNNCVLIFFY